MIEIEAPDGTIVEFPEGMPDAAIEQVMSREYGAGGAQAQRIELNQKPNSVPYLEGLARAGIQGGAFGAGDEMTAAGVAGIRSLGGHDFNETYDRVLSHERAAMERFRESNPMSAMGAEIAGSIGTAIAPAGAGMKGGSLLAATKGLATGSGLGAIYGFNSGEDGFLNRAKNAIAPALVGGALGAVAPAAANMVGRGVSNYLARRNNASGSVSPEAQRIISRALESDGPIDGQGARNIANIGKDGMVVDASENAANILDSAIQRSGKAGNIAREAIEGRATRSAETMNSALDDAFGAVGAAKPTRPADLAQIYDRAYSTPIDYASNIGQRMERNILDRVPGKVITKANELMRIEGERSRQILANIADDGTVTYREMPDVRQIDYITRALNEVADQADGAGKLGGTTQSGRAYANLSRELRSDLKEAVPAYREALDVAAGAIRERSAREFGETLLNTRVSRLDAEDILSDMGKAEKLRAGQGVRQAVDDTLANVRRSMMDTNMDAREAVTLARNMSSRANREKVAMLIGENGSTKLFDELDRATITLNLRASVANNSKTHARGVTDRMVSEVAEGGSLRRAMRGELTGAARHFVQRLTGNTAEARSALTDDVYEELVQVLTGPRGPDALKALNAIKGYSGNQLTAKQYEEAANAILSRASRGAAPAMENVR
jgi:hypothetical protein